MAIDGDTGKETIVIPFNKLRLIYLILVCVLFILAGFYFIYDPPKVNGAELLFKIFIMLLGAIAIIFALMSLINILKKIASLQPALIIREDGIIDFSSGVSAGKIKWEEISAIGKSTVNKQDFITIQLKDTNRFIESQENRFKKKIMAINFNKFGSAINIPVKSLNYNPQQLFVLLNERLMKHQQQIM